MLYEVIFTDELGSYSVCAESGQDPQLFYVRKKIKTPTEAFPPDAKAQVVRQVNAAQAANEALGPLWGVFLR